MIKVHIITPQQTSLVGAILREVDTLEQYPGHGLRTFFGRYFCDTGPPKI